MPRNKTARKTTSQKPVETQITMDTLDGDIASSSEKPSGSSEIPNEPTSSTKQPTPPLETSKPSRRKTPVRKLPPYNVPEKIIIVLDRACDEVFSYFELNNGVKYRPLHTVKNALSFFVYNKNFIDTKHEFAVVILNECSAAWLLDFTNDVKKVMDVITSVEECQTEDIFNLNCVFDLINDKIKLPVVENQCDIPPPYVVRAVLAYGRSVTVPHLNHTDKVKHILQSPYFTFDVVMTHEPPDSSNKCELIFKTLQQVDTKGYAHYYSVARNASELHLVFGKLTGHPLQRALQKQD